MPAIAAIKASTLLNGVFVTSSATIGVDKTYDPEGFILPGVTRWVDRSGGIPVGYPSYTLSLRPPTKVSRVYKLTAKLDLPTLEVTAPTTVTGIQPAPTKAYSIQAVIEVMIPERCTAAERLAAYSQLASLFAGTITASDGSPSDATGQPLLAAMINFDPPY